MDVTERAGLLSASHFELFGLPENYALEASEVERRYKLLEGQVHPDRHVTGSPAQRRLAEQLAARINEARLVLADPLSRAAYLLARAGRDPFDERDSSLPADFIEEQFELRAHLEEADADPVAAAELNALIKTRCAEGWTALAAAFEHEPTDFKQASEWVRKLKYLGNLLRDTTALVNRK